MSSEKRMLYWLLILSALFVVICVSLNNSFLLNIDVLVHNFFNFDKEAIIVSFCKFLDVIFGTTEMLITSLILAVIFFFYLYRKEAALFSFALIVGSGAVYLGKEIFARARPQDILINETDFSFPSGHATISAIFFSFFIYLTAKNVKQKWKRYSLYSLFTLLTLLVGFSRIYLNAHWFSDVVGGFLLGGAVFLTSILLSRWLR